VDIAQSHHFLSPQTYWTFPTFSPLASSQGAFTPFDATTGPVRLEVLFLFLCFPAGAFPFPPDRSLQERIAPSFLRVEVLYFRIHDSSFSEEGVSHGSGSPSGPRERSFFVHLVVGYYFPCHDLPVAWAEAGWRPPPIEIDFFPPSFAPPPVRLLSSKDRGSYPEPCRLSQRRSSYWN